MRIIRSLTSSSEKWLVPPYQMGSTCALSSTLNNASQVQRDSTGGKSGQSLACTAVFICQVALMPPHWASHCASLHLSSFLSRVGCPPPPTQFAPLPGKHRRSEGLSTPPRLHEPCSELCDPAPASRRPGLFLFLI